MNLLRTVLAALALLAAWPAAARAEIVVDVTRGYLEPLPIAVPDFAAADPAGQRAGAEIAALIRANLQRSGLFRPLDPQAFIERVVDVNVEPRFPDWRIINAQALVVGQATALPDGRLRIEFRLWDVLAQEQLLGLQYATTPENWRRIGHKISDAIYERLTGETGYFDSRVVYIAETGPRTRRVKRLAIMDQDGANPSFLTNGEQLVLTPRFSPTAQQITYIAYEGDRARVYLFNIETGRREALGQFSGISFAPRFSPDGAAVIMTMEQGGNSDIYRMDLRTRERARLTNHPAIDTSPSYSPDGAQIVFNSDRGGSPQLYVMGADGANPTRITFGEGRYLTPVWSPRGDLIAFTRQSGGRFQIGVIRPDGTGERILSDAYLAEGPTWSPNGRVLMFFREEAPGRGPALWSVDVTGQNQRRVETQGDASDPAWSPLLP